MIIIQRRPSVVPFFFPSRLFFHEQKKLKFKKKHKSAHALWLDSERGELFCRSCDDYVYDASFDACALGAAAAAWHLRGGARARPSSALAPPPLREAEVEKREREEEEKIAAASAAAAALPSMGEDEDEEDIGVDEELLRSIPRRPTTPSTAAALGAATDAEAALKQAGKAGTFPFFFKTKKIVV